MVPSKCWILGKTLAPLAPLQDAACIIIGMVNHTGLICRECILT